MFGKFIEIDEAMAINKNQVIAIEGVMWKKKEDPDDKAVEKTRITLVGGRQVLMDCKYKIAKRFFV